MANTRKTRPRATPDAANSELLQQGLALHQSGRAAEAVAFYERVLARDSRQPAANHLLGLVRLQQGRADEAVERISHAVDLAPGNAQYLSNLGVALHAAGRSKDAVDVLERAIVADITSAETFSNLGMVFRSLGRFDEAVGVYRRAVQLKPNEAGFHFNLANAFKDAGYMFDAESAYRRAVHLRPGHVEAINGLALMLDGQGRAAEALELVEAALRRQPDDPQLNLRRSRALYHQERLEEAVESFNRTIALRPGFGEAHLHRAYIVRHESRNAEVAAMEMLFRSDSAPLDDRIFAGFGLGKALADLGEHGESIAAFTEANRLHRARTPFSLEKAQERLGQALDRFEGVDGPHANGGFREASPIFVVGLPRSGKTTVETILSRHPSVAGAGELPTMSRLVRELLAQQQGIPLAQIPPDRFTELGRAYIREAQSLVPPGKVVVDTMPANFNHIGFIRMALPYARIVRPVRAPADHCIAIFEKYLTGAGYEYSNDLDELLPFHATFRTTMDAWRARFPGSVYDIDLGHVAEDRRGEVQRLLEFCGLVWNDACMADTRSEPQYRDWSRDRIRSNRADHLAAWREIRPSLFEA